MRRYIFNGGTAVVTGAASGIGEALAHGLARRGSHLVLLDRDAQRLSGVATAIRGANPGLAVETHVVDLADREATTHVAYAVLRDHPRIRLLVNNAGVALGGRFDQVTLDEFDWVVDINFRATVRLTHILLPALKAEPGSHLVNVSSLFGLIAPPGHAAYSASKFAVRGFTEARVGSGVSRQEWEDGRAQFDTLLTIDPAHAAEVIIEGIQQRRGRVLIGWSAKLPDLLVRLLPVAYGSILAAAIRARIGMPGNPEDRSQLATRMGQRT